MNQEHWTDIRGYEGFYEVSDLGRVRRVNSRIKGDGILSLVPDRKGYLRAQLCKNAIRKQYPVHRLVCIAFHGPAPEGKECGHRNGKSTDNRAENLSWITRSQNAIDAIKHGTHVSITQTGERHPLSRLSDRDIDAIRNAKKIGVTTLVVSRQFGISRSYVRKIAAGYRRRTGVEHAR